MLESPVWHPRRNAATRRPSPAPPASGPSRPGSGPGRPDANAGGAPTSGRTGPGVKRPPHHPPPNPPPNPPPPHRHRCAHPGRLSPVADTAPAPMMDLDSPFSVPPAAPVGASPRGTVTETPSTGRTGLGRGLGSLLTTGRRNSPDGAETRTSGNFSAGTPTDDPTPRPPKRTGDPQATAKIVVGLVGVTIAVGAWVLSQRGRKLRRPTREQIRDFAKPVGAILARHTDLSWLGADIEDLGTAAAVVTDYTTDGPIAPRIDPVVHVGMPEPEEPPLTVAPALLGPVEPVHSPVTYLA